MGIRGLGNYLKWKIPSGRARQPVRWTPGSATGQRWAIDCSCILYRARAAGLSPLTTMAFLLSRIRRAGVEPIVVFDGKPPAAKTEVTERRQAERATARARTAALREELATSPHMSEAERGEREVEIAALQAAAPTVGRSERNELKQFLYAVGVLAVTAKGEADDLLGWLARTGVVQAVVSTDYDMLARGVGRLIIPETADTSVCMSIQLEAVLAELRLTYDQFVVACTLMGSDYSPRGWTAIPPVAAIESARARVDLTRVDVSGDICVGLERAVAMLRGDTVTGLAELLDEYQLAKWAGGAPAKEPDALERFFAENGWPAEWRADLA
jgi:5'-3' exonuclease